MSGSGGTYDSTKEDEVKKVPFQINFTNNFYITVNLCRMLLAFLNDRKSQNKKCIYIYIFFFLSKQIQAKLKAQMVGIQVQFEKKIVSFVLTCLVSTT